MVKDLIGKAQLAMKQGHPEIAVIYLKNAEAVAPDSGPIHLDLGPGPSGGLAIPPRPRPSSMPALQRVHARSKSPAFAVPDHAGPARSSRCSTGIPCPLQNDHSDLAMDTLRARAYAQLQIGKPADAVASLEKALAVGRTTQNLSARAQLALNMGDLNLATNLVDEALKKAPSDSRRWR